MKLKNLLKAVILGSALTIVYSTVVMAAVPTNSVIIGSRSYDVNLLFNNKFTKQINNDLAVANGVLYYNLGYGWKDIFTDEIVSIENMLLASSHITYFDKDGIQMEYVNSGSIIVP